VAAMDRQPLAVTLYSKPGCHLCDVAAHALHNIHNDYPLEILTIDITSDPSIYERYRYRIPVVTHRGDVLAEGKVTEFRLRQALDLS